MQTIDLEMAQYDGSSLSVETVSRKKNVKKP